VKLTWTGTDDPSCVGPGTTVSQTGSSTPEADGEAWSGYVAQGDFSSSTVHARVLLPQITCNAAGIVSIWVGYDGFTNGTVEQDGVSGRCSGAGATPTYYLWYELYKDKLFGTFPYQYVSNISEVKVAGSLWSKLKPGVAVDMFVNRIPPDRLHGIPLGRDSIFFSLSVYNSTHTKIGSWSKTVKEPPFFSPKYANSECIVETPSFGANPLPNFGTITFQGCSAIDSGSRLTRLYLTHKADVLDSVDNYTRNVNGENQFLVHWLASR